MKGISKNKKGFTLVELLAVIVVLAIIIMIAMPSVMSSMEKARKNALVTEAVEIAKIAQTAYVDSSMNDFNAPKTCWTLADLKNGYLDKNTDGYTGIVMIEDSNGTIKTKIWLSNGKYKIVTPAVNGNQTTDGAYSNSIGQNSVVAGTTTTNTCE